MSEPMIPLDDMKPGLFLAIRFARTNPTDDLWDHVPSPRVWRVLSVSAPYIAAECLQTGQKRALDSSVYEFVHLREEFVRALFPDKIDKPRPAPATRTQTDERALDEQGYPKPVRLITINPSGRRQS